MSIIVRAIYIIILFSSWHLNALSKGEYLKELQNEVEIEKALLLQLKENYTEKTKVLDNAITKEVNVIQNYFIESDILAEKIRNSPETTDPKSRVLQAPELNKLADNIFNPTPGTPVIVKGKVYEPTIIAGVIKLADGKALHFSKKKIPFLKNMTKEQGFYAWNTMSSLNKKTSLWQSFKKGGPMMIPIFILMMIGVLIIIHRLVTLYFIYQPDHAAVDKVILLAKQGDFEAAKKLCDQNLRSSGRVMKNVLEHLSLERAAIEDRASEEVLELRPELESYTSGLNLIAGIAPLLGLLGTVTGMISTFWALSSSNGSNTELLSEGISQALLTTQFGLMVAIPAAIAYALIGRWTDRILSKTQLDAIKILNVIEGNSAAKLTTPGLVK